MALTPVLVVSARLAAKPVDGQQKGPDDEWLEEAA